MLFLRTNTSWLPYYTFLLVINSINCFGMYKVSGAVVDAKTQKLLKGVNVVISSIDKTFQQKEFTDEQGIFRLSLPQDGTYNILCIKKHYFHSELFQFSTIGKDRNELINIKISIVKAELGESYIVRKVDFEVNSTKMIIKKGRGNIDKLVSFLKDNKDIVVEVGAHTDSRGNDQYNDILSLKRAEAVRYYIISKGIANNRITAKGYGESKPLNHCKNDIFCSSENHLFNRRIEFKVISVKSK